MCDSEKKKERDGLELFVDDVNMRTYQYLDIFVIIIFTFTYNIMLMRVH